MKRIDKLLLDARQKYSNRNVILYLDYAFALCPIGGETAETMPPKPHDFDTWLREPPKTAEEEKAKGVPWETIQMLASIIDGEVYHEEN